MKQILGARIDSVGMVDALLAIEQFIKEKSFRQIITLNAEILYRAQKDEPLLKLINSADLVTPDGFGVIWAAKHFGEDLPQRVTGIDLMQEVCRHAVQNDWRLFLLGGSPGVADIAADNLREEYPGIQICGSWHGFFSGQENGARDILRQIRQAAPDVLFVAMGAPRQEFWIAENREALGQLVAVGVGGSFDVIAGRVKRAPEFWQRLHLEWLWRTLREPRRLGRIMVLPLFVLKVLFSKEPRREQHEKQDNEQE